jgi:hypothetical protein
MVYSGDEEEIQKLLARGSARYQDMRANYVNDDDGFTRAREEDRTNTYAMTNARHAEALPLALDVLHHRMYTQEHDPHRRSWTKVVENDAQHYELADIFCPLINIIQSDTGDFIRPGDSFILEVKGIDPHHFLQAPPSNPIFFKKFLVTTVHCEGDWISRKYWDMSTNPVTRAKSHPIPVGRVIATVYVNE